MVKLVDYTWQIYWIYTFFKSGSFFLCHIPAQVMVGAFPVVSMFIIPDLVPSIFCLIVLTPFFSLLLICKNIRSHMADLVDHTWKI